jgi:hypothetical protein
LTDVTLFQVEAVVSSEKSDLIQWQVSVVV